METNDKTQENRLRRELKKLGYRLEKSRVRNIHGNNLGGYQIIENYSNTLAFGSDYGLTLQGVEDFLKEVQGNN